MASQDQPRPKTMTYSSKKGNRVGKDEQKRQFTPRKRASESEDDGTCDLCALPIKIYAIGHCNHPICFRCSAKMRVLCEQTHCAVCRVEMKKVIYSKSRRTFSEANDLKLLKHAKANNWFTDEIVKKEYRKLFEHRCNQCPDVEAFYTFDKLKAHVRKEHQQQFCDICVKFNKNFTDEWKTYSREMLARHRRLGDEDDTSHRGHPLCEFCDERYLDNDALLLHLRTDHYFCHFCDQAGTNEYYAGYKELRDHYNARHFLCEEGDCINEQFTSVFATELDFRAHQTAAHTGNMTRQQQKAERRIDLGFQYANPPARGGRAGGRPDDYSGGGRGRGRGLGRGRQSREDEEFQMAKALSLSEQESAKHGSKQATGRPRVKTREEEKRKTPPPPEEEPAPLDLHKDFPTLGASEPEEPASLYSYQSITEQKSEEEKPRAPESRTGPTAATKVASAYGRSTGRMTEEDFPSLGSGNKSGAAPMGGIWASSGTPLTGTQPKMANKSKPSQPVSVNIPPAMFGNRRNVDLKNNEEFPSLGGRTGAATSSKSLWGQTPITVSAPKKPASKNKPQAVKVSNPVVHQDTTFRSKPQKSSSSDMIARDDTVSIRVGSGKHSMRLSSAKHNEDISDIERPIDVPGFGNTSVKTVTADTFSMLSGSRHGESGTGRMSFQVESSNEFPELGGGARKGARIKGIGGPKFPGDAASWGAETKGKSKKAPMSLSDISNDIFPSSTVDNLSSGGKKSNSKPPRKHDGGVKAAPDKVNSDALLNESDFPAFSKPPPISSYPSNWHEDDGTTVADSLTKKNNFEVQDADFPSLGGNSNRPNSGGGKKNKKKKKNKKIHDANDLTKHFGNINTEATENGGHLKNLLAGQKDSKNSLSTIIDQNGMFEPDSNGVQHVEASEEQEDTADGQQEDEIDVLILKPRPDDGDVNGRNMWLIQAVQQLCRTDDNFSEFKSCSAQFRQGAMFAQSYYEKCMRLLGKRHFPVVFGELVNLLPDEDKREELLMVHHRRMVN